LTFKKWGESALKTSDDKYSIASSCYRGVWKYEVFELPEKWLAKFDDREAAMDFVKGLYA
jgi:hypothetical protein